ncbi:MAG: hypothetical protein ACI865_001130 [Flavobacteriaceae bacterium]|jgi:hypothetical protein
MKKTLLLALFASFGMFATAQTDIADGRTYGIGQTITVTGVATNGSELGSIRYMQDATAGIAAYGSAMSGVSRGDSITVTGPLIEFSGLLEISPAATVVNHGPAVVQVIPLQIPIPAAVEALESQLMQVDNVTFVQTGSFAGTSANYQITDGTNILDVRVNASTNIAGTAIPTGPVTVFGALGQFNTSYQLVPRDLNDIIPYVAPSEEINVLIDGVTYLNNSTYFIGNSASAAITIQNSGSNVLTLTGGTLSGVNAGDFSHDITAGSVAATSNNVYTLTYVATITGSTFATLEIGSNDSDENPYTIYIEGVGTDNLATEPTANPTALTFPVVEAYTVGAQYTAGTGGTQYVVFWRNGSAMTAVPVDGTSYLRGDIVGDARVAYVGTGTSFTPRGIIANQDYYFSVYTFNGAGAFVNYLETTPLTGNTTSLGEGIGAYYSGIDKTAGTFVSDLTGLINPHTVVSYFLYKQTLMTEFELKDTIGGQTYVTCALSGEKLIVADPFDWSDAGYSREHTFAHSWMPTFPADVPEEPEYNDQHNLYPANLVEANIPRSNLPLNDIDGAIVDTYLEGNVGYANGELCYQPRASHRGNAARAIMYMAVAYNFDLNGNVNSTKQSQELLKSWHFADLPDNYEIARNEYIFNQQGNRNPFIDSTDYACFVNFDDLSHVPTGCIVDLNENYLNSNTVVFPVPSAGVVYVQVNGTEITSYNVYDLQGRLMVSAPEVSLKVLKLDKKTLGSGTFIINVQTPLGEVQRKMIIQ